MVQISKKSEKIPKPCFFQRKCIKNDCTAIENEIGNENKICRIGQLDLCNGSGCEWKKVFGNYCWENIAITRDPEKPKEAKAPKATPPKVRETQIIPPKPLTPGVRSRVYHRDGHKCLKCGTTENLTLDEVVPKSKGGKRSYENCQTLCSKCNGEKGSKTIDYRIKNENEIK